MRRLRSSFTITVASSILFSYTATSISMQSAYSATSPKAGVTCNKLGLTSNYNGKKFTCIKSGKKLVWDKGIPIAKAPISQSTSPSPTTSVSPSANASMSSTGQAKKTQSIFFEEIPDSYLLDNVIKLKFSSTSGLVVSIKTESSVICRYKSETSELSLESTGTCSVTASQPGNDLFSPAENITRVFQIRKKEQVIRYKELIDHYLSNDLLAFETISSADTTLNVSILIADKSVCSYQNSKVKMLKIGTCSLQLSQPGNRFYNPAPTLNISFNILEPLHKGTVDDPQSFNRELSKNGVIIKLKSIKDEVSEYICKLEIIQDGCDFGGTIDPDSYTRYAQIDLTVENNSSESWVPSIFGLYLDDQLFGGDFIEKDKILENYELKASATANLSLYVALDKEIKLTDCLLFISESVAEEAFYFRLK